MSKRLSSVWELNLVIKQRSLFSFSFCLTVYGVQSRAYYPFNILNPVLIFNRSIIRLS